MTKKKTRKRTPPHRWQREEGGGARCLVCGAKKVVVTRPGKVPLLRVGIVEYRDAAGVALGRDKPSCLTGKERQTGIFDPTRFE